MFTDLLIGDGKNEVFKAHKVESGMVILLVETTDNEGSTRMEPLTVSIWASNRAGLPLVKRRKEPEE